jgi:hypothetical protein
MDTMAVISRPGSDPENAVGSHQSSLSPSPRMMKTAVTIQQNYRYPPSSGQTLRPMLGLNFPPAPP